MLPPLLKKLFNEIRNRSEENLRAGFRKSGIHPINPKQVLSQLPDDDVETGGMSDSLITFLHHMRYRPENSGTNGRPPHRGGPWADGLCPFGEMAFQPPEAS